MLDIVQEDMTLEDDSRDPFYEISTNLEEFTTFPKMFLLVYFVFVLPLETNIYYAWMGRALTIVQLESNHSQYGKFQI